MVMLYQVAPPSQVRRTRLLPIAQPVASSSIKSLLRLGDGTTSGFTVGGRGVSVIGDGSDVNVGVGVSGTQAKVDMTCAKTADSAALSKTGGGVEKAPGLMECRTKSRLMQALPLSVE